MELKEQILINSLNQAKTIIDTALKTVTDEQRFELVKQSHEQMRIDLLDTNMKLSKFHTITFYNYVADYINEELTRGRKIAGYQISDAIAAFEAGAGNG